MARRSEIMTVYAAGVVQGIGLVTFPAASAVFTSPTDYNLSSTEYGGLFLPQAIMAILASLAGAGLRNGLGTKKIYLVGLFANLLAMALLLASRIVMNNHGLAYGILLVATTCMGIGFGFTVPALNTFAAAFFPQKVDKAVLALNALLGLGTALAPIFVAVFVGFGIWWGLPELVGALILGLLFFSFGQPLNEGEKTETVAKNKVKFPARFWIFAAFALLYGVCETMNGNWAALYLKNNFHASAALSSLALTIFWSTVTAGRILFAVIEKWLPEEMVCRILPLVVTAALIASACAPKTNPVLGVLTFALAGLVRRRAIANGGGGFKKYLRGNGGCRARAICAILRRHAPTARGGLKFRSTIKLINQGKLYEPKRQSRHRHRRQQRHRHGHRFGIGQTRREHRH